MAKYVSLDNAKRIQELYQNIEISKDKKISNIVVKSENLRRPEDSERNDLQKYVWKDLLRTFIFILFAVFVIFAVSIFVTDFSYAKNLRESLKINQIKF